MIQHINSYLSKPNETLYDNEIGESELYFGPSSKYCREEPRIFYNLNVFNDRHDWRFLIDEEITDESSNYDIILHTSTDLKFKLKLKQNYPINILNYCEKIIPNFYYIKDYNISDFYNIYANVKLDGNDINNLLKKKDEFIIFKNIVKIEKVYFTSIDKALTKERMYKIPESYYNQMYKKKVEEYYVDLNEYDESAWVE